MYFIEMEKQKRRLRYKIIFIELSVNEALIRMFLYDLTESINRIQDDNSHPCPST